jgi:hypothetical protein
MTQLQRPTCWFAAIVWIPNPIQVRTASSMALHLEAWGFAVVFVVGHRRDGRQDQGPEWHDMPSNLGRRAPHRPNSHP